MAKGNSTNGRSVSKQEKVQTAFDLRKAGMSYRQIVDVMGRDGIKVSTGQVHGYVMERLVELAERTMEDASAVMQLELTRLDDQHRAAYRLAMDNDQDPAVRLRAINTLVRVAERRSRLLGLDAPVRAELTGAGGAPVSVRAELAAMGDDELEAEAQRFGIPLLPRGDSNAA